MTRLEVSGLVDVPRTLGFDELAALGGQVEDVGSVLEGKRGSGVRFGAIADAVKPAPEATHARISTADGAFSAVLPVGDLRDGVVAYRLGDAPLPDSEGGPLRFLRQHTDACRAGTSPCANVKGLARVEFVAGADAE